MVKRKILGEIVVQLSGFLCKDRAVGRGGFPNQRLSHTGPVLFCERAL